MHLKMSIFKISKNKKLRFLLMSQGALSQKIRFLGQKLWPVACEQTDKKVKNEKRSLNRQKLKFSKKFFFVLFMSHWANMPKIRFVGRMEWPVANTKTKKEKTKMPLKMSIFKIFDFFLFYFFFSCHNNP